jgi:hypothetical protein
MPLDLSRLAGNSDAKLIEPRDIYTALPDKPWTYLRFEQGEVLEKWFLRRTNRDIVLKQNTGGGKTVAGLLIAQSSLNEGVGPVGYFASDSYLVEQVIAEANRLGLKVTDNPRSAEYLGHEAILVATLQRLINGRSVFGVDGESSTFLDLGTAVIDDAHAALANVEQQFRLTAKKGEPLYDQILALFAPDLEQQSHTALAEIQQGISNALLRIPFWSWQDKQAEVVQIALAEFVRRSAIVLPPGQSDDYLFQWPLVKDYLSLSIPIITGRDLEIRPPCPPIHKIPSFVNARRRIYMTATLADDAVLVTDLNAAPDLIAEAVTPGRASDIGDRMILAPLELNPTQDPRAVMELARAYADGLPDESGNQTRDPINVVVICPSDKAAARWSSYADRTWSVGDLKRGVAELKSGHVGLVVLANKYDGIDLAGSACRLLIVDGLPRTLDAVERREAGSAKKSHKVIARQVQRVEQGMGRGVRDASDYCAVLLLGDDLTHVIHDPKQRALFSPATRVQLDISRRLAEQLQGTGMASVKEAINVCLDRERAWVEAGRTALAQTNYDATAYIRPEEVATRRAFDRASARDYRGAEDELQPIVNAMTDPTEKGWLMEHKASYLNFSNATQAQQLLLSASIQNHHVLRPLAGISVERLRAAATQAQGMAEYASRNFADGLDAIFVVRELLNGIQWDKEKTEEAERNWEQLGLLLGFGSERPEKKYLKGPDNMWSIKDDLNLVFELKTGADDRPTKKDYIDQLGGSVRWHDEEYARYGATSVPVLMAPSPDYDRQGTPPPGTRVIGPAQLDALKKSLSDLAIALRPSGNWQSTNAIAVQLAASNLTAERFIDAYTTSIGRPVALN